MRNTRVTLVLLLLAGCSTKAPAAAPVALSATAEAPPAAKRETPPAAQPTEPALGANFTIKALNGGRTASIAPGKVTVVDFWATWCAPCAKSFPALQALYSRYQSSGLEIIGLSNDDDDSHLVEFAAQHGAKFPIALDKDQVLAGKMKVLTVPTSFVFDKKGKQRFVHEGYKYGEDAQLEKEIKQLLAEP